MNLASFTYRLGKDSKVCWNMHLLLVQMSSVVTNIYFLSKSYMPRNISENSKAGNIELGCLLDCRYRAIRRQLHWGPAIPLQMQPTVSRDAHKTFFSRFKLITWDVCMLSFSIWHKLMLTGCSRWAAGRHAAGMDFGATVSMRTRWAIEDIHAKLVRTNTVSRVLLYNFNRTWGFYQMFLDP